MKLSILSNDSSLYSTKRLKQAAKKRSHTVRVLKTSNLSLIVKAGSPSVAFKGKVLARPDAVIPRIAVSVSAIGAAAVRHFEQMGVFSLNSSSGIAMAHDKLRTMQILSRHALAIPATAFVAKKSDALPAIDAVGGPPVVIKILKGAQGSGVILAETRKAAQATIEALQAVAQPLIVQKFLEESRGRDIRAFVIGDRVAAAMRRVAAVDEFRSNLHLGGSTEKVVLDSAYQRAAVLAAHAVGLRVAGVDLLETKDGPVIIEVNSSPGLEGIELCTEIDVAGAIIQYLEDQILFPEVDIKDRLSLGRGYVVVELPVLRKSLLAHRSIEQSGLWEQEIQVLSIMRNTLVLPSPSKTEVIYPGDKLVCFGRQLALRELVPRPRSRRKRTALLQ